MGVALSIEDLAREVSLVAAGAMLPPPQRPKKRVFSDWAFAVLDAAWKVDNLRGQVERVRIALGARV